MHEHLVVWYTFFVPYFILQLMKLGLGFAGIASSSWQRPLGLFAEDGFTDGVRSYKKAKAYARFLV